MHWIDLQIQHANIKANPLGLGSAASLFSSRLTGYPGIGDRYIWFCGPPGPIRPEGVPGPIPGPAPATGGPGPIGAPPPPGVAGWKPLRAAIFSASRKQTEHHRWDLNESRESWRALTTSRDGVSRDVKRDPACAVMTSEEYLFCIYFDFWNELSQEKQYYNIIIIFFFFTNNLLL